MADPQGAHARPPQQSQSQQPSSYPSPHSYPSPSLNPSYTYPPPQGPQNNEPYRASPSAQSGVQIANLNLPPIREIDGQSQSQAPPPPPQQPQQQQQSQQQPGPPPQGAHLPPPSAHAGGAYYPQQYSPPMPSAQQMSQYSSPPHAHQQGVGRYPLPPQQPDQRMMSGGRHKKEIKRRTKTGCLTCRKRRIKCDEAHPTCRNCQKSKRECAGYDPIFKPQPGPPLIQAAPTSSTPANTSSPAPPAPPQQYSNVPQGYAPASASTYLPPVNSTTSLPENGFDFNAPIDPALGSAEIAQMGHERSGSRPDLKGPFSNNGMYPGADRGFQGTDAFYLAGVKKNRIDDLFAIANIPPPAIPSTHTIPADLEELKSVFKIDFAPGLDRLLDTTYYQGQALEHMLNDREALLAFSYLISLYTTAHTNYEVARTLPSLEAKTTWSLLTLCRRAQPAASSGTPTPEELAIQEAKYRLDVLEHLITGHTLDANPLLNLSYPDNKDDEMKIAEVNFWKQLGAFVTLRDDDASQAKEIESHLAEMRAILLQQENRDVIYSVAIIRHVGTRMNDFPHALQQAYNNNADENRNKVIVARKFLEEEAQGGMTLAIARVAGMVVRSWVVGTAR